MTPEHGLLPHLIPRSPWAPSSSPSAEFLSNTGTNRSVSCKRQIAGLFHPSAGLQVSDNCTSLSSEGPGGTEGIVGWRHVALTPQPGLPRPYTGLSTSPEEKGILRGGGGGGGKVGAGPQRQLLSPFSVLTHTSGVGTQLGPWLWA